MEPQVQADGSGGRIGGPPEVACGFSPDDDQPRRNVKARRDHRPAPLGLMAQLRVSLKSLVSETERLSWPNSARLAEHAVGALLLVVLILTIGIFWL